MHFIIDNIEHYFIRFNIFVADLIEAFHNHLLNFQNSLFLDGFCNF